MGKVGKPPIVDKEVDTIFRKLEPYLKKGLSLHKICLEAQIPKSTTYDLYQEYDEFAERIDACKNYHSLFTTDVIILTVDFMANLLGLMYMIREIFLNFIIKDKIVAFYKETKIPASRGAGN